MTEHRPPVVTHVGTPDPAVAHAAARDHAQKVAAAASSMPPRFEVERHGGRANCDWHVVFSSDDYETASDRFSEIKCDMRQGGLRLIDTLAGGRRTERYYQAPLLRNLW